MLNPLFVLGTRPECIKMASTIHEMERRGLQYRVCSTSQHREMLLPFLEFFRIRVDHDLEVMKPGQDLFHVTTETLLRLRSVLKQERPDAVIVQGDTTTAMAAALASFYEKIPVAHIEAGLRTGDLENPFPEEMNRRMIDHMSKWLFAPTLQNVQNLVDENICEQKITRTGNTVIDSLHSLLEDARFKQLDLPVAVENGRRIVLVTAHRRESFGAKFEDLCQAILIIANEYIDVEIVYPVHLNPNVREPVFRILGGNPRIRLIEPLDYFPFLKLMQNASLILTDSGGVQEEAPTFGTPVLVMRDSTERTEGLASGNAQIVGTDTDSIVDGARRHLSKPAVRVSQTASFNPYGDGRAAERIVNTLFGELADGGEFR